MTSVGLETGQMSQECKTWATQEVVLSTGCVTEARLGSDSTSAAWVDLELLPGWDGARYDWLQLENGLTQALLVLASEQSEMVPRLLDTLQTWEYSNGAD